MRRTPEDVKRLADKYALKTADQMQWPPAKARIERPAYVEPPAEFPPHAVGWSTSKRQVFRDWGIHALQVQGTMGPIQRGLGDNSLGWPLRLGHTGNFADSFTKQARSMAAYEYYRKRVWFRIWVPSLAHVSHLVLHVLEALPHEQAEFSWITVAQEFDVGAVPTAAIERDLGLPQLPEDAPPEAVRKRVFKVARAKLERFMHAVAARQEMPSWSDEDVNAELDRRDAERKAQAERVRHGQMAREVGDRGHG